MELKAVEAIYLRWASQGRSADEIAEIEQTTVSQVTGKLDDVARRLGVDAIGDAVKKAREFRLI